jgi:small conductance mechanosensitive channel
MKTTSFLVAVWFSTWTGVSLLAEDAPAAPAPKVVTSANTAVPMSELKSRLKPKTLSELKLEADAWQTALQTKAVSVSEQEILAAKIEKAEDRTEALNALRKLQDEETQIIDRLKVVLVAYKAKGGKVEEYDQYIAEVSGITLEVTDAHATWTTVVNWAKSSEGGIRWAKNIGLFIVTLIVFKILAAILGKITLRMVSAFKGSSEILRDFSGNVVRRITMFVGFVIALSMLEVNIGPFLAAMGAAGFIIGFALQGTLGHFASGVMILLYRPYDLGDRVTAAGQTGKVTSMTLVSTLLVSDEGKLVIIPNSSIWGGVITNHGRPTPAAATGKS